MTHRPCFFIAGSTRLSVWLCRGLLSFLVLWFSVAAPLAQAQFLISPTPVSSSQCEDCLSHSATTEPVYSACSSHCMTSSCCMQFDASAYTMAWLYIGRPNYATYQVQLISTDLPISTPPPK